MPGQFYLFFPYILLLILAGFFWIFLLRGYAKQTDLDGDSIPLNFSYLFQFFFPVPVAIAKPDILALLLWLQWSFSLPWVWSRFLHSGPVGTCLGLT